MNFQYRHGDRPLEGYTILRGVGRGGFGEVYYAVSDGGREVALKSILSNHEIELRGVKHCINLKSPHLVSIFDVRTTAEGMPFVVMEFVGGPSLREILRDNPRGIGEDKAAFVLREIAKGMAYLHERGIVHRDLKPENIFFEEGYVKIGDYGLSKYISASRQSGQTISVGTVHYMAPEIGSGIYDRSIDIYAAGIILYELLTGEVPFTGHSFGEILMKHLAAAPNLDPIPESFRPVIAKALAKKPDERYRTIDEMAADLFRSEALASSVALLNPESLSVAARKAAAERAVGAVTPPPLPPPLPSPPPPAAEARQAESPAPPAAQPAPSEAARVPRLTFAEAEARDALPRGQRVVRAVAIAVILTFAAVGFDFVRGAWIGYPLLIVSSALGVLASEFWLRRSMGLDDAFVRRCVTVCVVLFPAILCFDICQRQSSLMAFVIGFAFVDWGERASLSRESRFGLVDAFLAGLAGFIVAAVSDVDPGLPALALGGASLLVNALAPLATLPGAAFEGTAQPAARGLARAPGLSVRFFKQIGPIFEETIDQVDKGIENMSAQLRGDARGRHGDAAARAGAGPAGAERQAVPETPSQAAAIRQVQAFAAPARVAPALLTRIFWIFAAACLTAGGLSAVVVLLIDQLHPEEKVIAIGAAIGCFTYTAFAFYRGFWARSPFIWSRTLLPFLTATAGGSILWSGAVLLFSGAGGYLPVHADMVLAFTIYFACASVLLVFFLGCGWLFAAPRVVCPPGVRYRFRPLHPLARFLALLLAAAGMAGACGCALAAFSSAMHPNDRIPFLCGAAALLSAGLFFLRQGVRRTRGSLWEGYVRPFVLAVAGGTIAVCVLFLVSGELRYRDERMLALIAMVCAGVFGAFAAAIKGRLAPLPHEAEFLQHLEGAGTRSRAGGSLLRGAAMMCWLVGVFLLLAGASVENGFWHALLGSAFPAGGSFARGLALGGYALLAAGTLFALAVRRGAGSMHVFRAALGFAALWWAVVCFAAVASAFRVSPEFAIATGAGAPGAFKGIVGGMIGIVLGSALVSWPCRRRIAAAAPVKER